MSSAGENYGSAQTAAEGAAAAEQYDLDNTYYVKERTMSRKERCSKLLLVMLPIVLAVILVGGFAYYVISHVLERGAGGGKHGTIETAYPASPKGSSSIPASRPGTYPASQSPPAPAPKTKSHSSSASSSCSSNSKCADLGLIGDCCPTKQGVTLGCCD